jgi:hypothetical protein
MQAAKRPGLAQETYGEQNEVTKDLRETFPLPRNHLHTQGGLLGLRGSDRIQADL